ncbi:MAG: carotenoid oxygenase family protein [Leptolyngbya sp. SIO4C1]|nr:carotenoid oxygenase family protein [Leptolyngbya sp. SIO4C1]
MGNYRWHPDEGTRFYIVDCEDGSLVNTCETEPFFAFHYANAFEQDGYLIIDAASYPDASAIEDFYLETLRLGTQRMQTGQLTRYAVPLQGEIVRSDPLTSALVEFPRIHYRRCNGRPYRFVYGGNGQQPRNFIDQLVKVDVTTGNLQTWQQPNCYPGEPVFVAAPEAAAEDDGVLLTLVLDAQQQQTSLFILDARSFSPIAQATVPHVVPFGFHGQFFS